MAFRRYRRKVRPRRKTRVAKRRMGRRMSNRLPRRISNQIHYFREVVMLSDMVDPGTLSTNGYWYPFTLNWSSIPQLANYQNLFESAKILKCTFVVEPYILGANASAQPTPLNKYARLIWDPEQVTTLTETAALQYGSVKSRVMTKPFKFVAYPKMLQTITTGAVAIRKCAWLDLQTAANTFYMGGAVFPSLGYTSSNAIARVRLEISFCCKGTI